MSSNDNVDSNESVVPNSSPQNKKLSHVCIFEDCQNGKRGGKDYCNKHSWLAAMPTEYSEKKLAMDKKILNTQIIMIPVSKKNQTHLDESMFSKHDDFFNKVNRYQNGEQERNFDKDSLTSRDVILVILMSLAGLSLALTYDFENPNWYIGCVLFFYAGILLNLTSIRHRRPHLILDIMGSMLFIIFVIAYFEIDWDKLLWWFIWENVWSNPYP